MQDNPHVLRLLTEILVVLVLVDNIALNRVMKDVGMIVTRVQQEHIVTECMDIYAVLVAILLKDRHLVQFALRANIVQLDKQLVATALLDPIHQLSDKCHASPVLQALSQVQDKRVVPLAL